MPTYNYELTSPLSVSKSDALALIQDPKQFLIAGGNTEEDSIKYDEQTNKWHGTGKSGIPVIPKPTWTATFEKTSDGGHWVIDAGMGITSDHTWTVEGTTGDEVCFVTEKVQVTTPLWVFHAAKWTLPQMQKSAHKSMQEFLS